MLNFSTEKKKTKFIKKKKRMQ